MSDSRDYKNQDLMADFDFDERFFADEFLRPAAWDETEEKRILANVLAKADLKPKKATAKTGISRRRLFVFLVAAVILVFAGSLAVADVVTDGKIAVFFGASENEQQILTENSEFLNIRAEDQGSTLTVRQVLGDEYNVFVLFDITAPQEQALSADWYLFEHTFVDLSGGNQVGYYFECLTDEAADDNKISMMLILSSHNDLRGQDLSLLVENLYTTSEEGETSVLPGCFQLDVPLKYDNMAKSYALKEPFVLDMSEDAASVTIKNIEISPLTVTLSGDINLLDQLLDDDLSWSGLSHTDLRLILKDGSVINCVSGGNSSRLGDIRLNFVFERMVDPQLIDQVEYRGQVLAY
jgi:hypothetical protein